MLDAIVAHKRGEVSRRVSVTSLSEQERRAAAALPVRSLNLNGRIGLIAEVKRRSPSKGALNEDVDPVQQAAAYARGGAAAVSVLTDERYFGGRFEDLAAVREAVGVPVLCKDFFLSPYQVYEARGWGADLVLLIVAALRDNELITLHTLATDLGMLPLVEVHDQHDLARAIAIDARMIGINNRDLTDFSVDLVTTEYLAPLVPDGTILVSESGITSREDVTRVVRAGATMVLVGEALMKSGTPEDAVRELLA